MWACDIEVEPNSGETSLIAITVPTRRGRASGLARLEPLPTQTHTRVPKHTPAYPNTYPCTQTYTPVHPNTHPCVQTHTRAPAQRGVPIAATTVIQSARKNDIGGSHKGVALVACLWQWRGSGGLPWLHSGKQLLVNHGETWSVSRTLSPALQHQVVPS